ncbi:MAG: hypothetical protein Cons2KO_06830 [Congregibacter sp.]
MRWFFLLLPWVELFTLIQLGGEIGALATLLYVFLSFVAGLSLLRLQGQEIGAKLRMAGGTQVIGAHLFGAELAMGLAGVLLMIPGLVTDFMAAIIVVLRLIAGLRGHEAVSRPLNRASSPHDTIEGEYRRLDDD